MFSVQNTAFLCTQIIHIINRNCIWMRFKQIYVEKILEFIIVSLKVKICFFNFSLDCNYLLSNHILPALILLKVHLNLYFKITQLISCSLVSQSIKWHVLSPNYVLKVWKTQKKKIAVKLSSKFINLDCYFEFLIILADFNYHWWHPRLTKSGSLDLN